MKSQLSVAIVAVLLLVSVGVVWNLGHTSPAPKSAIATLATASDVPAGTVAETATPHETIEITKEEFDNALKPDPKKTDPYQFLHPVAVGAPAPDFSVKDANGDLIKLSDFKGKNNVVLIFYQGHFCAICGKQLNNIQMHIQDFREQDAVVLAVSADDFNHAQMTLGERGLSFHIIPDPNKKLIDLYGVHNTAKNIAWPSAYVIDKKGKVQLSYASKDGHRLHSSDFLPVLSKITGKRAPSLTYYE